MRIDLPADIQALPNTDPNYPQALQEYMAFIDERAIRRAQAAL